MTHSFFVPGIPKTTQTGSVIRVNGRAFPIRRNTSWSQVFGIYAQEQAPKELLDGALVCEVTFVLPAPKSTKRPFPYVRPDAENLWKGLGDQLNGVVWHDDAQVCRLVLNKGYAEGGAKPGVHVYVCTL